MNGLGLGASKAATPITTTSVERTATKTLLPSDYFNSYNVEGGLLKFVASQTAGGTGGWLKIQFPNTNQSNISGVSRSNAVSAHEAQEGFKYKLTFDIFLETAADWTQGAGNTQVTTKVNFGNVTTSFEVTPDQSVSIDTGVKTIRANNQNNLLIFFNTNDDLPEAGAVFYLKNFQLQTGQDDSGFS